MPGNDKRQIKHKNRRKVNFNIQNKGAIVERQSEEEGERERKRERMSRRRRE